MRLKENNSRHEFSFIKEFQQYSRVAMAISYAWSNSDSFEWLNYIVFWCYLTQFLEGRCIYAKSWYVRNATEVGCDELRSKKIISIYPDSPSAQVELSNLLPTSAALKYKIFLFYYVALVLGWCFLTRQNMPSPLKFGWKSYGEAYLPILTDDVPVPLKIIDLGVCYCKTKCARNKSKWRKNGLQRAVYKSV